MARAPKTEAVESFFAEWKLKKCRDVESDRVPAPHQTAALKKLGTWYRASVSGHRGGILALPTGGGKTFTAVHFLCGGPLSDGFKVLWLAHTHHLLEQAFRAFSAGALAHVREPRETLSVRVVSGTAGHFAPREIRPSDDVVIATLQTVTHAHAEKQASLKNFLLAAKGKLIVVFDEAHHAPAPSYRKLLDALRKDHDATLLGLTATPTYTNEAKRGWLGKLFPQGVLAHAKATDLMAAGILAKPIFESCETKITPQFSERDFQKWLGTFRDVPESVIEHLAKNEKRNAQIAARYIERKARYGKTIIFTDRWAQCEAIVGAIHRRDKSVRAASLYSHVDASTSSEQPNRRNRSENANVLARFRKGPKDPDALDVIVNVRMLTEGTDLPDARTVFITRQTTSQILLTQMVGRALRGPRFGGTAEAYIVSFVDDWQQAMRWAVPEELGGGTADDDDTGESARRARLQGISTGLVRQLARQIDGGENIAPGPFLSLMPAGWYRVTFDVRSVGSDDIATPEFLVLVFEDEQRGFESAIAELAKNPQENTFGDEAAVLEDCRAALEALRKRHLQAASRDASDLRYDLFQVARHIAQGQGNPQFFLFDARKNHDLDAIARDALKRDLRRTEEHAMLTAEYGRTDRFWGTLLPSYDQFRTFYESCVARLIQLGMPIAPKLEPRIETPVRPELSAGEKSQVKRRDGGRCVACGSTARLQVDHVDAVYHGGSHQLENLQTLCGDCNRLKRTRSIRFNTEGTPLTTPPKALEKVAMPADAGDREQWEQVLRRIINFTLQCRAVTSVTIGGRGETYYNWDIELAEGISPAWIKPHLGELFDEIQQARDEAGKPQLKSISVSSPGKRTATAGVRG